jgi:DNA-binding response OmpR family regulator
VDCTALTVLIVDDDVNAQIIAATLLRIRDFHVCLAGDGITACAVVQHEEVAVVVLDTSLLGMNGAELVHQLRGRTEPLPTKPRILVVTGRQAPEVERSALRLGADAFLRKPLDPRQFIATVRSLSIGGTRRAPGGVRTTCCNCS